MDQQERKGRSNEAESGGLDYEEHVYIGGTVWPYIGYRKKKWT